MPPDLEGMAEVAAKAGQMYVERQVAARGQSGNVDLTKINFPVLALVSEHDYQRERTHPWRELKNFQSVTIPGCGHLDACYPAVIHEEYTYGLLTFINSHDARATRDACAD
jgi:hypothetical protein